MRTLWIAFAIGLLITPMTLMGQLMVVPNPLTLGVTAGASPVSAVVNVTFNGSPVPVNAVSSITTTGQNWLLAAIPGPAGIVTVTADPSTLAAGTYVGSVTAATPVGNVSFAVNLTVGGGIPPGTPAPSSLLLVLTGLVGVGLYQAKRVSAIWR